MFFIADIASNHDGDINRAIALIQKAKECGINAVKFQYFKADTLINAKQFRDMQKSAHQKEWKESVYQTYKKYEIPLDWIPILKAECDKIHIEFMCTIYDIDAVDFIDKYVNIHKIGSGDIAYRALLEKIAKKKKLTLLGTGASNMNEVIIASNLILKHNPNLILMQCNTNYTTDEKKVEFSCINVLKSYQVYFPHVGLGLSDHSKSLLPVLSARSLGAEWIERHFSDGQSDSPDNGFSLTPIEWKYMISEVKKLESVLGNTFKEVQFNEMESQIVQRRCIYAKDDLEVGEILNDSNTIALRPIVKNGISPLFNTDNLKLRKNVKKGDPITFDDLEIKF